MYKGRDDLISPEEAEKGVEIVSKICGVDKKKYIIRPWNAMV